MWSSEARTHICFCKYGIKFDAIIEIYDFGAKFDANMEVYDFGAKFDDNIEASKYVVKFESTTYFSSLDHSVRPISVFGLGRPLVDQILSIFERIWLRENL